MMRQTAFEAFPNGHPPADKARVKRLIGELIDDIATQKKGRLVGFPVRAEVMELEYLNALLERPDTQPLQVPSPKDAQQPLMTHSHPDRYLESPYTSAQPPFLKSQAADRIRAARTNNQGQRAQNKIAICEDILGLQTRYDPNDFSGVQLVYGQAFIDAMPADSDAKKQHDHMLDIYRRAEALILHNKWWNGPGLDCDFRVDAVEYLPSMFSGEAGMDLLCALSMLKQAVDCVPTRYVSNKRALKQLKLDMAEFTAFLRGKESV